MEFCERVKYLREQRHMTQQMLADRIGVSLRVVKSWEGGENKINIENICRLADFFHTTTDFLLGRTDSDVLVMDNFTQEHINIVYSVINSFDNDEKKQKS